MWDCRNLQYDFTGSFRFFCVDIIGKLSIGYDFLKGVIDVSLGNFNNPQILTNNFSGVYFICPSTKGVIKKIIDNTWNYPIVIDKDITVKVGDKIEPVKNSTDRKGYYIYKGSKKIKESNLIELVME